MSSAVNQFFSKKAAFGPRRSRTRSRTERCIRTVWKPVASARKRRGGSGSHVTVSNLPSARRGPISKQHGEYGGSFRKKVGARNCLSDAIRFLSRSRGGSASSSSHSIQSTPVSAQALAMVLLASATWEFCVK